MAFDPSIRPVAHFAPARGWMNDPNGLIYHDGTYHLFFQHDPTSLRPDVLSWGHAVSPDLVTWTELPIALTGSASEHKWSGNIVIGESDVTGTDAPAFVAIYTEYEPATGKQSQALAVSRDRGLTWDGWEGNPVLDTGSTSFRDPNVTRDGDAWVMVIARPDRRVIQVYRSGDLVDWELASEFGPAGHVDGVWECPDLFPVRIEGTDDTAMVLLVSVQSGGPAGGSGVQYWTGEFADLRFVPHGEPRWVDFGSDFYAAIAYENLPPGDAVVHGWMSNWLYAVQAPATEFRGAMTAPRRLSLRRRDGVLVLRQTPVVPAGSVVISLPPGDLSGRTVVPGDYPAGRVVAEFEAGTADRFGLEVRVGPTERTEIAVDPAAATVTVDRSGSGQVDLHPDFAARHAAPLPGSAGRVRLDVIVDAASVEVFAADGEASLTDQIFPSPSSTGLVAFAEGGTTRLVSLVVTTLT